MKNIKEGLWIEVHLVQWFSNYFLRGRKRRTWPPSPSFYHKFKKGSKFSLGEKHLAIQWSISLYFYSHLCLIMCEETKMQHQNKTARELKWSFHDQKNVNTVETP